MWFLSLWSPKPYHSNLRRNHNLIGPRPQNKSTTRVHGGKP